jgi:hypothetical protein
MYPSYQNNPVDDHVWSHYPRIVKPESQNERVDCLQVRSGGEVAGEQVQLAMMQLGAAERRELRTFLCQARWFRPASAPSPSGLASASETTSQTTSKTNHVPIMKPVATSGNSEINVTNQVREMDLLNGFENELAYAGGTEQFCTCKSPSGTH